MTPRDRRAVRLGLGVILLGVILGRVLPAGWRRWQVGEETFAAEQALVARGARAISALDSLEQRARSANAALVALAPHLLTGTTEASALADLQGRVALAAGRHRTKLVRADQIRDSVAEGRLRAVSVRVEVESDWSGLVAFLRATVADPAVLRVRSIGIRGPEAPTRTAQVEVLTGEVEVMGWYLPASAMEREDAR